MDKLYLIDYTNGVAKNITMFVSYKLFGKLDASQHPNYTIVPDIFVEDNFVYLYDTDLLKQRSISPRGTVEGEEYEKE